jgi:peptidoglycan/xylan/chitin deacetylase (PgdA/CDA1 family)
MHHGFTTALRRDDPEHLFVTATDLRAQLEQLLTVGWTPLDLDGFLAAYGGQRPARGTFLLTIDDGFVSTADIAAPILRELNVPAVLFMPAGLIGQTARWLPHPSGEPLMDADTLRELSSQGVEIGGHGWDHTSMTGMDEAQLRRQVVDVRQRLADAVGVVPRAFAYPYGAFDTAARRAVEAAYDIGFSVSADAGASAVSRVDVNSTDTLATMQLKELPGYRALWRMSGHVAPVRRAIRNALVVRAPGASR